MVKIPHLDSGFAHSATLQVAAVRILQAVSPPRLGARRIGSCSRRKGLADGVCRGKCSRRFNLEVIEPIGESLEAEREPAYLQDYDM